MLFFTLFSSDFQLIELILLRLTLIKSILSKEEISIKVTYRDDFSFEYKKKREG